MKILVANLGSTSFKYKIFDMPSARVLAQGGMDRIGSSEDSLHSFSIGDESIVNQECNLPNHESAIEEALNRMVGLGKSLESIDELKAVGFKAVHARNISGVVELDDDVISRMEDFFPLAPAHNPAYVAAIRQFENVIPTARRIGCFETAFHGEAPLRRQMYAVPYQWYEDYGIMRYGFHGASHCFAAERVTELEKRDDLRHVNMHLGGSSSVCGVKNGVSLGASHGLSPQGGLPQNNRIGDLDPFALDIVIRNQGISFSDALEKCASQGGLLGICGYNDLRDIQKGAEGGDKRCQLALDVLATTARDYLGAYIIEMGGIDVISFTGGIGEKSSVVRSMILRGLEFLGIEMDSQKNEITSGSGFLHTSCSKARLYVITTDEELVVARQTYNFLQDLVRE
tara:strand:+ start:70 stop:1266 length:1197 start_codon:yes stop_codon:yes gene_type:complete